MAAMSQVSPRKNITHLNRRPVISGVRSNICAVNQLRTRMKLILYARMVLCVIYKFPAGNIMDGKQHRQFLHNDITELMQIEEALKHRNKTSKLFGQFTDGINISDVEDQAFYANQTFWISLVTKIRRS